MAREIQRSALPIPDQPSFGLVTYDARDPDTSFPPVEPLRPPEHTFLIATLREQWTLGDPLTTSSRSNSPAASGRFRIRRRDLTPM